MGSVAKKGIQLEVITAGVISAISDITSQKFSGIQKLNSDAFFSMCRSGIPCLVNEGCSSLLRGLCGAAYIGPFEHYFYIVLDKIFKGKKDNKSVAKKVLLGEVTSLPWNNFLFMLYYGLVIEARPWVEVKSKIKKEFRGEHYTAWTVSPVVGWIMHRYIPLQFQVVFGNLVGLFWSIFMNLRAKSSKAITKD